MRAAPMIPTVEIPTTSLQTPIKGRAAVSNSEGRFAVRVRERADDGWDLATHADERTSIATEIRSETARSLITRNNSEDIPFSLSINPYRGCEHGCIYCFARPTHSYLDLSPGLDFETRLVAKHNAAQILAQDLSRPGYRCEPIALGTATDPYQPIELQYRLTRQILEVALNFRQPLSIVTKSRLILDDLDLLAEMAREKLISVMVSVTTLDNELKRVMEPRAASGQARVDTIAQLRAAGVPTGVMVAPVIPVLNDHEIERIIEACAGAGAQSAAYVLLRLPLELKTLFQEWLHTHFPDRERHVLNLLTQMRGGKLYDSRPGHRMRGEGPFADLLRQRFEKACRRHGITCNEDGNENSNESGDERTALDCSKFAVPGSQLSLW